MLSAGAAIGAVPAAFSPCGVAGAPPSGNGTVLLSDAGSPGERVLVWAEVVRSGVRSLLLAGVARADGSDRAKFVVAVPATGGATLLCVPESRLEEGLAGRSPTLWQAETSAADPPANRTADYYLGEATRLAGARREASALRFRAAGLTLKGMALEKDEEYLRLVTTVRNKARESAFEAYERQRDQARARGDKRAEAEARSNLTALSEASSAEISRIFALWAEVAPRGMVLVPGGVFEMGSNRGDADMRPVHSMTVSSFFLGEKEVMVSEYEEFARLKGVARAPFAIAPRFSSPQQPVVGVSWNRATEYCAWRLGGEGLGGRLPTEAEWEYAARHGGAAVGAGDTTAGESPGAIFGLDKVEGRPESVGSLEPSPLGLYDMAGNVAEWVLDWHSPDTYRLPTTPDFIGPATGKYRVVRGGSWRSLTKDAVDPTRRAFLNPEIERNDTGFRCASPLAVKPEP